MGRQAIYIIHIYVPEQLFQLRLTVSCYQVRNSNYEINFITKIKQTKFFQEICWIRLFCISALVFSHGKTIPGVKRQIGKQQEKEEEKNVIREIAWHLSKCIMGTCFYVSSIWLNRIQFELIEWEKSAIDFIMQTEIVSWNAIPNLIEKIWIFYCDK